MTVEFSKESSSNFRDDLRRANYTDNATVYKVVNTCPNDLIERQDDILNLFLQKWAKHIAEKFFSPDDKTLKEIRSKMAERKIVIEKLIFLVTWFRKPHLDRLQEVSVQNITFICKNSAKIPHKLIDQLSLVASLSQLTFADAKFEHSEEMNRAFSRLKSVTQINIHSLEDLKAIDELACLENLNLLTITHLKLRKKDEQTFLDPLTRCSHLSTLLLDECTMSDCIFISLSKITQLSRLILAKNKMAYLDRGLARCSTLKSLTKFELYLTHAEDLPLDQGIPAIVPLPALSQIFIHLDNWPKDDTRGEIYKKIQSYCKHKINVLMVSPDGDSELRKVSNKGIYNPGLFDIPLNLMQ